MNVSRSLNLLKRASWHEVLFLSILIVPFPLLAWTEVLSWLELNSEERRSWVAGLMFLQIFGIVLFVAGSISYRKKLSHLTLVLGYLQDKKFKMVSFQRLQQKYPAENISEKYGRVLIRTFPDQVRLAMLKDKQTGSSHPGIARLDQPVDLAIDSPDQD
ncbi:hypothetical protein N9Z12_04305 [Opitutaceae bacterium]|nr:hypothetical protein [Opitutaceae bacterium]